MSFPLAGVKILDLGDEPVVLAARLLADLGADVVRVESQAGDTLRQRGPFVHDEPGLERSLAHVLYNAGKRSVALDTETSQGEAHLRQLISKSVVVVAPLERSPCLKSLLTPRVFEQFAPQVGLVQPVFRRNVEEHATDLTGMAAGGQLYLNGDPADPPNHPAGSLAYKQLSLASALAAMSMILESAAGRAPGRIEVSMQEAVMWTTIQSANENYAYWDLPTPGRRGLGNIAGQSVFLTSDSKFVSFTQHPPAWPAFARWYGELFGDEQYTSSPWDDGYYRFQNNAVITRLTERVCASMDRTTVVAEAQKRGILCVPVQDVASIATDEHLRERGFYQRVQIDSLGEELELVRPPFISSSYRATARPAPGLGQHTAEVLSEWCGIDVSLETNAVRV